MSKEKLYIYTAKIFVAGVAVGSLLCSLIYLSKFS